MGQRLLYSQTPPGEKLLYSQFLGVTATMGERLLYNNYTIFSCY